MNRLIFLCFEQIELFKINHLHLIHSTIFLRFNIVLILLDVKNYTFYDASFKLKFDILTQEDVELDSQDAGNALSLMEIDLMAIVDQFDFYPSMEKK